MNQRFACHDRLAYDRWHNEELSRFTVANTPENLARTHRIFAYQSSFMQNIVEFTADNFHIRILAQPFNASPPDALLGLTAGEAASLLRQFQAFLTAAREWEMDFLDFSQFQLLPGPRLRFPWRLEPGSFPGPGAWTRLFKKNRHLRGLNEDNYLAYLRDAGKNGAAADFPVYLYRCGDFSCNLLHAHAPGCVAPGANAKIRINTRHPWQKEVIRNILFQNLKDGETLLLKVDLESVRLSDYFAALCASQKPAAENLAAQAQEFRCFLKKSVFRAVVLLIDNLARKEDDRLLRFILESGDVCGLSVILFNDSAPGDCDLEFNEDPPDPLLKHFAALRPDPRPELDDKEIELLAKFAALEVPLPVSVALLLVTQGDGATQLTPASHGEGATELPPPSHGDGAAKLLPVQGDGGNRDVRLESLLKKGCLIEDKRRQTLSLPTCGGKDPHRPRRKKELLAWLADHSEWTYARVAHLVAGDQAAELERFLEKQARESPGQVAPGPAADLLCRHLARTEPGGRIREHFVDILIQRNCLDQAAEVLAAGNGADPACSRLQAAHLAMRRKDYRQLGSLLAGLPRVPRALRDEWLYLNYIFQEKTGQVRQAAAFEKRIASAYYRNLAAIQWSDRCIYNRDFVEARARLDGALEYFSSRHSEREEIETQSQIAKLHREMGDFPAAESLYKTIYIRSESDGLALNSANAAVDLGNLYLENDDEFQAECWYRKAAKAFAGANNQDGAMLVNSNLLSILCSKGSWLEADRLLRAILAWDEEKRLLNSCAIDYLNWANLETLRLHDDLARQRIEQAAEIFGNTGNRKGLSECAFARGRLSFFAEAPPAAAPHEPPGFNDDQKIVRRLFDPRSGGEALKEAALFQRFDRIRSRKIKFEALRLLLKKHRKCEWLDRFQELARELSPRTKNYYYFEYWYMFFDLGAESLAAERREEFLAMHDFFTVNKRTLSAKLDRLRRLCDERERDRALFDDARLVGDSRHWRLPEDFFNCFSHELGKPTPLDWLVMSVHEDRRPLFRFANSELFRELGDEMLHGALAGTESQNLDLAGVKKAFRSQERFFYPYANTKMVRWPISDRLLACLVIGFKDGDAYFQDFFERRRETFKKFSVLFRNFLENEFRINEKLNFIVGASEKINEMKRAIAQVSKVDFSLLITGESGSGKELVARAVHLLSPRAAQPFISVNAAAIPETLLEAELFGYRKGAFSGAHDNRVGLLEAADRGTLFLDEIADLPLPLQAKLLRALQEKEIRRLGENQTIKIDVRLVSASNKDLDELIRRNMFRADLFYRLQDLVIHIPPLRERREDVPLLIGHFLEKFGYPAQAPSKLNAISAMFAKDAFPGNVRELESKIKKMITFDPELEAPALRENAVFSLKNARGDFERNLVLNTLVEQDWHKGQTAERLGISRMALFNLLKKHGISR